MDGKIRRRSSRKALSIVFPCALLNLFSCSGLSDTRRNASRLEPVGDVLLSMRELQSAANQAFESNHVIEGLKDLIGILSLNEEIPDEQDPTRKIERAELVRNADSELTATTARMTLEPTEEWIVDGKQVAGSLRNLGLGVGLQPSVRLVMNYDFGKAVVADAPIQFSFIEGEGELSQVDTTDINGNASATVHRIAQPDQPVVIRSVLSLSARKKGQVFPGVSCEFSFIPTPQTIQIIAFERRYGVSQPQNSALLVESVARGLASQGMEILPGTGTMPVRTFMAALAGDGTALTHMFPKEGAAASYVALAYAENDQPRQLAYNGKTYAIYTSDARVSVRILRSDGSLLKAWPQTTVRGQGSTADAASGAAFQAARDAMEQYLEASGTLPKMD